MEPTVSDLFIIGGGINGTGIAADAAGRGLSVTLCEQNDLASGTSSVSSKLIHGGLRYLATYEFGLVRKALQEREVLLRRAPHLIRPLEFVLPHAKHLRPTWMIRLGLMIYDHLAAHPSLPNSHKISLHGNVHGEALKSTFKTGFTYFDCYDDDARLVIANAMAAAEQHAAILTHTTCHTAHYANDRWQLDVKNNLTGELGTHYAKVLINASGPWLPAMQQNILHAGPPVIVELIKGSHIIVRKLYDGDFAYILQNADERVVFTIPYENDFTLIGTTDIPYTGDMRNIISTPEEERYLCDTVNYYFQRTLSPDDILWSYAGVRCLQASDATTASEITRDYKFSLNQQTPLLSVISGKITTYRRLAEEAVDALKPFFPTLKPAWTAGIPLPGGDIPQQNIDAYVTTITSQFPWLPKDIAHRYARQYGTRVMILLHDTQSLDDLGAHIAAGLYQKEVDYLRQHEWAQSSEDILWRRTKLGLYFTPADIEKLDRALSGQI